MADFGSMGLSRPARSTAIVTPLVLIVDDDAGIRAALTALLSPRLEPLFRVESVASAEAALELLDASAGESAQAPLALVITDELMPGLTGTDLLIALRQHPAHRDGGRMVITAYASLASAKRAINEAQVDRYFPKPWDAEGELLPAVGSILSQFVVRRGFDRFLVASQVRGKVELEAIRKLRETWWSFVTLADEELDVAAGTSTQLQAADSADVVSFVVHRVQCGAEHPVATARLRPESPALWVLDGMAFLPAEANDEVETLLVRTALAHAALTGVEQVRTAAPTLRQAIYRDLGFELAPSPPVSGATHGDVPPCSLAMQLTLPSRHPGAALCTRFAAEKRLCACFQTGCVQRDYAADVRGYYCPLDVHEGRVPPGFPGFHG